MVRVKATGETTEVDREVMKALRNEEKKLRRSYDTGGSSDSNDFEEKQSSPVLSLDAMPEDDVKTSAWLADPHDFAEDVLLNLTIENFKATLTQNQKDVFICCMMNGESYAEYALRNGVRSQSVQETVCYIKKKAKNFFKKF